MKNYLPHIKKYKHCFILGPVFMILEACGEFLIPYLNANIIDKGAMTGDKTYIIVNGIYMLLLAVFMLATGILGANFAIRGAAHLAAGIRKDTFDKIQTFSFANIDAFTTGSLITRITNDVNQVQTFTQSLLRGFFRSPVMLIGAIAMSFALNPKLALIFVVVVPLMALSIFLIIKIASPRYDTMQRQLDTLNTGVGEAVTNERVIKSFVREEFEKSKFSGINESLMKKSVRALKVMIWMQPVSTLMINVTTLLVVWFSGKQIMVGDMEVGTLTAFITYLSQVLMSLNFLANIFLQGTRAAVSSKRIKEVLNAESDIVDTYAKDREKIVESGDIEFKDVTFRYVKRTHETVLHDINLKINSGELVGVVGSTGAGKTALVSLISRLYDTDKGEVLVDGVNVRELSLFHLRDSVSVVLQKNTLFSGTISENLRWGKDDATYEQMREACKIAQADDFIMSFPDGYETELGQGGINLSGGQKQRICIARALLKTPKILVLDDSTSAVDTATDAKIRKAFRKELSSVTKIIIAQRISSVKDADKIIVLDAGALVGFGSHDELIKTCKTYQEIYYSQKDKEEAVCNG